MYYKRNFTINGKTPSEFSEGTIEKVLFKDTETGFEFNSFIDMVKHFEHDLNDNCATTQSFGTEQYHGAVVPEVVNFKDGDNVVQLLILNTWTDGVQEFIENHEAYWLTDVIGSYLKHTSETVMTVNPITREQGWKRNLQGLDSFVVAYLVKLSESSAMFTIEMDGEWNEELETTESISIATQFIPFTDIDVDSVEWFIKSGVTLFPQEH